MEITPSILETIQKVIAIHAPKYKVPGYDVEDIAQEAFIIALDCLKSWDEDRGPLENYLSKHFYYRLRDFVRNTTLNDSIYKDTKKRLLSPLDISLVNAEDENALVDKDNVIENVEIEEILRKIDEYLPVSLRKDYLRMKSGVKVNRGRATKIKHFVQTLLDELTGKCKDE